MRSVGEARFVDFGPSLQGRVSDVRRERLVGTSVCGHRQVRGRIVGDGQRPDHDEQRQKITDYHAGSSALYG